MNRTKWVGLTTALMLAFSPMALYAEEKAPEVTGNTLDNTIVVEPPAEGDIAILPEKDLSIVPEDGIGSIDITLTDTEDNLPKENVVFGLVQVADIESGLYVMNEPFDQVDIDINDIKTANDLEEASRLYKELVVEPDQTVTTNKLGLASFDKIPVGVYLIYAIDIANYEVIDPFVVAIPTWDEADELMTYDVDVLPKHSHLPVVEVNKVDSQTGHNIVSRDFEFTSYSDEECQNKLQSVSGNIQDGIADFIMTYGTIYIRETKAPTGYELSDEVVKVEFTEDGFYINDQLMKPQNEYIYSISYANEKLPSVDTGVEGENASLYYVLGATALGAGVLMLRIRAKRK